MVPVPEISPHIVVLVSQSGDSGKVIVRSDSSFIFNSTSLLIQNAELLVSVVGSGKQAAVVRLSGSQLVVIRLEVGDQPVLVVRPMHWVLRLQRLT